MNDNDIRADANEQISRAASIESLVINLHCSSCCATVCLQLKTTMDCIEINEVKIRELRETVSSAS